MDKLTLDKSSNEVLDRDVGQIQEKLEKQVLNFILCSNSFHKIELINKLIKISQIPVIVIDFDFLYTGYVESKMIEKNENLVIFNPDNEKSWNKKLVEIITKISKEKFLVIIDSMNGFYNICEEKNASRIFNSCLMLIASFAKNINNSEDRTKSTIVVTALAKEKESRKWVLSPNGKQIFKFYDRMSFFLLKKTKDNLVIESLGENVFDGESLEKRNQNL